MLVNTMEVLNTRPLSELVTEATIKVCWVDDEKPNRNNTLITEFVGREIAATLPGAPVVGFFKEEEDDFQQHSVKVTITDGQVNFESLTRPYGFVAPQIQPWYQMFLEDGIERKYIMCKAYLWTKQYPEASKALGKGQSMELNADTMSGYYRGDVFVFTSATLDRLCILGDNFEPCFEGARIATSFSKLYTDFALEVQKIIGGRYSIMDGKLVTETETVEVTEPIVEAEFAAETVENTEFVEQAEETLVEETQEEVEPQVEQAETQSTYAAEEAEVEESAAEPESVVEEAAPTEEPVATTPENDFALQIEALNTRIAELEQQLAQYQAAEEARETEEKHTMVDKYRAVLSEDDLTSIEAEMANLSLDELESKLSVSFARKQLAELDNAEVQTMQFNVAEIATEEEDDLPDFFQRAREIDQEKYCF